MLTIQAGRVAAATMLSAPTAGGCLVRCYIQRVKVRHSGTAQQGLGTGMSGLDCTSRTVQASQHGLHVTGDD